MTEHVNIEDILSNLEAKADELATKLADMERGRHEQFAKLKDDVTNTRADLERDLKSLAEKQAEAIKELSETQEAIRELKAKLENPVVQAVQNGDDTARKDAAEFVRDFLMTKAFETGANSDAVEIAQKEVTNDQIELALTHMLVMNKFFRHRHDIQRFYQSLTPDEMKALNTFTASGNSFFVSPQMSRTILSCVEEPQQVSSLFAQLAITKSAIKLPVDDVFDEAVWACESDCYAGKSADMTGLTEKEIPANTLRWTACVSRDMLEDASINVIDWIGMKGRDAFTRAIERGVITGDGKGMPMGVANARSCIPRMQAKAEADGGAPDGQFTWQDLVMLKHSIHSQYHGPDMAYIMSQDAVAMVLTMSDANGRPIYSETLTNDAIPRVNGTRLYVSSYLPGFATTNGFATGATPVMVGNWRRAYTLVRRRGIQVQRDDYSFGFCVGFKFEARIGGDVLCCNAARILVVR